MRLRFWEFYKMKERKKLGITVLLTHFHKNMHLSGSPRITSILNCTYPISINFKLSRAKCSIFSYQNCYLMYLQLIVTITKSSMCDFKFWERLFILAMIHHTHGTAVSHTAASVGDGSAAGIMGPFLFHVSS